MSATLIRVAVFDSHPLVHGGVRHLLAPFPDLVVAAEAYTEQELLHIAGRPQLDVLLIEVADLERELAAVLRQLRQIAPTLRQVVFTSRVDGSQVHAALAAGADGFLLKRLSSLTLAATLRSVAVGQQVIAPEATQALVLPAEYAPVEALSERESEVLTLLVRGMSNKQIAEELCVSVATVKFHLGGIFNKLGVDRRTEVIVRAYDLNLVPRLVATSSPPAPLRPLAAPYRLARSGD